MDLTEIIAILNRYIYCHIILKTKSVMQVSKSNAAVPPKIRLHGTMSVDADAYAVSE